MSLDIKRLKNVRVCGSHIIARCPACAEKGGDRAGNHLKVWDRGRGAYHCIVHDTPEHRRRVRQLAGAHLAPDSYVPMPRPRVQPPKVLNCPPLWQLTGEQHQAIAFSRNWSCTAGLELLSQRGLLYHALVHDDDLKWPAWVITDSRRTNAQARKYDGGLWTGIGGEKAKSLPGSDASWPIGAPEIGARPIVILCEGQPDFVAALLVAWYEGLPVDQVAPVCVTGAGQHLHRDSLPLFFGKHVRIAVHNDTAGHAAGSLWSRQLLDAGAAEVDGLFFGGRVKRDGQPVNDLADHATLINPAYPPPPPVFADLKGIAATTSPNA
jgi:hypothetical protein